MAETTKPWIKRNFVKVMAGASALGIGTAAIAQADDTTSTDQLDPIDLQDQAQADQTPVMSDIVVAEDRVAISTEAMLADQLDELDDSVDLSANDLDDSPDTAIDGIDDTMDATADMIDDTAGVDDTVDESADDTADDSVDETADDSVDESADDSVDESADDSVDESADDSVDESADDSVDESP